MSFRLSTRCTVEMTVDDRHEITCTWLPKCPADLTAQERRRYVAARKAMLNLATLREKLTVPDRSEAE